MDVIYLSSPSSQRHPFYKKNIVFTGALSSMTRSNAAKILRKFDVNLQGAVNDQTDFVILGDKRKGISSKEARARILEQNGHPIQLINEADFLWIAAIPFNVS